MPTSTWPASSLAALICSAFLGACGGGGDAAPSAQELAEAANQPIVTMVPEPTYRPGSDAWQVFQRLNANRSRCGFGLLAQNAQLDQAAAAHLNYAVTHQNIGHYEDPKLAGFTGVGPRDRAAAAGYVGRVGEDAAAAPFFWEFALPRGEVIAQMLMDVPYHAVVALSGLRDVGIAYGRGAVVINPGLKPDVPVQTVTGVRTYPCEGIDWVRPVIFGENPNPFPEDSSTTPWGPTISVVGSALRVTAATVTGPTGPAPVKAILGDGQTRDPFGACKGPNACVILQPLEPATDYRVQIEGTDAGVPFTKDFRFRTALD